jgi:hypothetical protein
MALGAITPYLLLPDHFHLSHMDLIKDAAMSNQLLMANNLFQNDVIFGLEFGIEIEGSKFRRNYSRNSGSGPFSGIFDAGVAGIIF